jgi:hypothetical protein
LNQAFAGTDDEFYRLTGAGSTKFFEGTKRVADDFVESLSGVRECGGAMAAFEQFHTEIALKFLELAAELALSIRIIACGGGNSACGDYFSKRFQTFEREAGLSEEIFEHDRGVMMVVFSAINKAMKFLFNQRID